MKTFSFGVEYPFKMFNLDKCVLLDNRLSFFFSYSRNNLKYAVIFAHKGKINTSLGTVKGLLICVHSQYQENFVLL